MSTAKEKLKGEVKESWLVSPHTMKGIAIKSVGKSTERSSARDQIRNIIQNIKLEAGDLSHEFFKNAGNLVAQQDAHNKMEALYGIREKLDAILKEIKD